MKLQNNLSVDMRLFDRCTHLVKIFLLNDAYICLSYLSGKCIDNVHSNLLSYINLFINYLSLWIFYFLFEGFYTLFLCCLILVSFSNNKTDALEEVEKLYSATDLEDTLFSISNTIIDPINRKQLRILSVMAQQQIELQRATISLHNGVLPGSYFLIYFTGVQIYFPLTHLIPH